MIQKYPTYWSILLGQGTAGAFLAYFTFAAIAAVIIMAVDVAARDKASPATPTKFSLLFFLAHNAARLLADVLSVALFVRLFYTMIPPTWMPWVSVLLGAAADLLAMVLKNSGILAAKKLSDKIRDKLNLT